MEHNPPNVDKFGAIAAAHSSEEYRRARRHLEVASFLLIVSALGAVSFPDRGEAELFGFPVRFAGSLLSWCLLALVTYLFGRFWIEWKLWSQGAAVPAAERVARNLAAGVATFSACAFLYQQLAQTQALVQLVGEKNPLSGCLSMFIGFATVLAGNLIRHGQYAVRQAPTRGERYMRLGICLGLALFLVGGLMSSAGMLVPNSLGFGLGLGVTTFFLLGLVFG